ncbi:iron-enterobactin transporter permease [Kocuria varians]|uniref:Iron-enterobactin transporter permease n=1 Tax=Kocuria varians TaxID=1272 RepID=A0A4Y4CZ10_KOCVA|nr:iron chelate uptake ABC transporter family permease subunit [Kocuria varians]GEC98175.1 iron-enterobactin transporter permease [Kocuria varians]
MSASTAPHGSTPPSARPAVRLAGHRPVRIGSWSAKVHVRSVVVTVLVVLAALGAGVLGLVAGSARLGLPDVVAAFTDQASEGTRRVILGWRLPRILFDLVGGAALAIAGAVFQAQTRNPLGSPDIIGFSTGAYSGVLLGSVMGFAGAWETPLAAVGGGLLTGLVVYLLAWQKGVSGLRIIIVGIGVSLFLGSVNTYLLTTMRLEDAISAAVWGAGSVNDVGWSSTVPLLVVTALILPVVLATSRDTEIMEMGDDAAAGLGVRLERVRLVQFLAGIVLVAVVTAGAGPIAFVALVSPQVAVRLTGRATASPLPAAAVGALLLTVSDLLARSSFMPVELPVGVVTLCLGGAYFLFLLINLGRTGGTR